MNESNDDNKVKASPSKPALELKYPHAEGKADSLNNNEKNDYGGKSGECESSNKLGATLEVGATNSIQILESTSRERAKSFPAKYTDDEVRSSCMNDDEDNDDGIIPTTFSGDVEALSHYENHDIKDGLVIAELQVIVPWYKRWKIYFAVIIMILIVGVAVMAIVGVDELASYFVDNSTPSNPAPSTVPTSAPSSSSIPSSTPSRSSIPSSTPSSKPTTFPVLEILQDLYYFTSGDKWKNNDNWLSSSTSWCNWYGVRCAADTETIIDISLYQNNLQGSIPSSIGLLSTLKRLGLAHSLTGTIPSEIGLLSSLKDLSLSHSSLSGSIPSEISLLTSVQSIFMEFNSLTGTIPTSVGLLSSLKTLYLGVNSLSGSIPSEIGMLSNLYVLSFLNNNIMGSIPSELGLLSSLEILFNFTPLSGTIPTEVGLLSSLKALSFYKNQLSGTIPSEIGMLSGLYSLSFEGNNKMNGTIPFEVCEIINSGVRISTSGTNIDNNC